MLRHARKSSNQEAAVSRPSRRGSATLARQTTTEHPRDAPELKHCFQLRITFGKQTAYRLPAKSTTAAASSLAGRRWDNRRRKQVEASPERCASLPRLVPRSSPETLPRTDRVRRRRAY